MMKFKKDEKNDIEKQEQMYVCFLVNKIEIFNDKCTHAFQRTIQNQIEF